MKQSLFLWARTFKNWILGRADGAPPTRPDEAAPEDVGDGVFKPTTVDLPMSDEMYSMGFSEITGDSSIYKKDFVLNGRKETLMMCQYVDDCVIISSSTEARKWLMDRMSHRFPVNAKSTGLISMKNPGLVLSMNVYNNRSEGVFV